MNMCLDHSLDGHSLVAAQRLQVPYSRVFVNAGEPPTEEGLLEFRLLYQGELLPSGNRKTRPREKHAIRRAFHPQLRRQWEMHSGLRQLAIRSAVDQPGITQDSTPDQRFKVGIEAISNQWSRAGYDFVPLVTDEFALRCSLSILLLRPEEDHFIFERGDIDGQVKTIFDALRIPANLAEAGGSGPQADERPFYCLLSDDKLISEVHVTADQLLLLPEHKDVKPNDAFVVIHVKLNHRHPGAFDRWFD